MLQFSLRNLLVAVAAVAIGTGALLNANSWWASLLWASVLLMLGIAGFVAFFRRGAQRAFWSGYGVAGCLYLLLLIYSMPQMSQTNTWMPYGPLNYSNLVTTKIVAWAYSLLPTSKTTPWLPSPNTPGGASGGMPQGIGGAGAMFGGMGGMMVSPQISNPDYIDPEAFTEVGQALWMFLFSWLGGSLAFGLFRTRDKSNPGEPERPANT